MPPGVVLFVATTFASAFLIFLVQPIVAKSILPWFGGVPAVWSLCLAFYQTTLFAGYAYAHLLIARAGPRVQLFLHAAVVAAAALTLPVLPSEAWKPEGVGDPSALILAMLLANVALPIFALGARPIRSTRCRTSARWWRCWRIRSRSSRGCRCRRRAGCGPAHSSPRAQR
ncbi:MAG: hypothetical protein E6J87_26575 [Deltaproteobacteria bacterium]|nr:MAG: hypothetical protein E6J87_26575 [Deltaproteobacteria bacterium]